VPHDELGDRFPGTMAGTIGPAALGSPDELAIVVGHTRDDLAAVPDTHPVSRINTAPRQLSASAFYQFGFAMAAVALLVPLLVLIGTATRLAAARREERFAALRLVGGTKAQIDVIASVDAVVAALAGTLAGIAGYALLRPAVATVPILDDRFFPDSVTVPAWVFAAAIAGVPVVSALASLLSLRRVQISPLGVSRRVTPPAPRIWRVVPLLLGLVLFCVPLLATASNGHPQPGFAVASLAVVMFGLILAGPWLTMQAARLLARIRRGGSSLIAARRLADNPRAAFRAVSGLVLAVLVGTALATIVPAAIASQDSGQDQALGNVIRTGFGTVDVGQTCAGACGSGHNALSPAAAAALIAHLKALGDVAVLPLYVPPRGQEGPSFAVQAVVSCADLRQFPAIGECAGSGGAVRADASVLFTDNLLALNRRLPLVTAGSPNMSRDHTALDVTGLDVAGLLVKVDDQATLERARTVLTTDAATAGAGGAPQTFGEVGKVRTTLFEEIQRMVTVLAGLTLLIAGCSLAIAVSGSLVERKRPFTLLRLTGTSAGALYRVVLLETVSPLVMSTLVAAVVGFILATPVARTLAPARHVFVLPGATYFATMGIGLVLAAGIVVACLPILNRVTQPDSARFE
jgi:hypothetical protein